MLENRYLRREWDEKWESFDYCIKVSDGDGAWNGHPFYQKLKLAYGFTLDEIEPGKRTPLLIKGPRMYSMYLVYYRYSSKWLDRMREIQEEQTGVKGN